MKHRIKKLEELTQQERKLQSPDFWHSIIDFLIEAELATFAKDRGEATNRVEQDLGMSTDEWIGHQVERYSGRLK